MALVNPNSPSEIFRKQMVRMFGNWTVSDAEMRSVKAEEFREIFDQVGVERFSIGVREAIWNHKTGFFPTLAEFMQFVPERKQAGGFIEHTAEEWDRIRAEQQTPEFREQWTALMKKAGFKEVPWPDQLGKIMGDKRKVSGQ